MLVILLLFVVVSGLLANEEHAVPNSKQLRNNTHFESDISTNAVPDCDLDELVRAGRFVDKTGIIRKFLEAEEYAITVSAPPRFGKSINMELIRRFCDFVPFENFTLNVPKMNEHMDFFETNNFSICWDAGFYVGNVGRYPVIFLDFKNLCVKSLSSFLLSLKHLLRDTFNRFRYLLQGTKLNQKGVDKIFDFYMGKRKSNPIASITNSSKKTENEYLNSLFTLSYLVHHSLKGLKCVILIDNYDAPVIEAMSNVYDGKDTAMILSYFYKLTQVLVTPDEYVKRVLLNVRYRIGPIALSKTEPEMTYFPLWVKNTFSSFYGFTKPEVKSLLHKGQLLDRFKDVRDWYGGFTVTKSTLKLFNPYSVVKYLETNRLENHWAETSYLKNTEKLFLQKLINSRVKRIHKVKTAIGFAKVFNNATILRLREIINNPDTFKFTKKIEVEEVLQVLAEMGFFNVVKVNFERNKAYLKIPNHEIKQFFYLKGVLTLS